MLTFVIILYHFTAYVKFFKPSDYDVGKIFPDPVMYPGSTKNVVNDCLNTILYFM